MILLLRERNVGKGLMRMSPRHIVSLKRIGKLFSRRRMIGEKFRKISRKTCMLLKVNLRSPYNEPWNPCTGSETRCWNMHEVLAFMSLKIN